MELRDNTYTDLDDMKRELTQEEISFFNETVSLVKEALGVDIEVFNDDHEKLDKKHKEALGLFYTSDLEDLKKDCFITIDNFFIHECFEEEVHGKLNLSFKTLEEVLCHELAHSSQFRHCKRHEKIKNEMLEKVMKYKESKNMDLNGKIANAAKTKLDKCFEKDNQKCLIER